MIWKTFECLVNGYQVTASYSEENIKKIFLPLVYKLHALQRMKQNRILICLAAPPAAGKSTLVEFLCHLAKENGISSIQAIGMDGFHYPNNILQKERKNGILLKTIKGAPETFDVEKMRSALLRLKHENILWPIYDRNIHEPIKDYFMIDKDIVLLEGNYLLLDEEPYKGLKNIYDLSIFITADEEIVKHRLIHRKAKGGLSFDEATAFYNASDRRNVRRVLQHTSTADVTIKLDRDGLFHMQ